MKILIVEDDRNISDLIYLSLCKVGYACVCVYEGMEAANHIEAGGYDLILLDIMLPRVDGYELMEYIEEMGIPAILITAKSRLEDKLKGLRLGAEDYITKPFEIAELTARVETVLRRFKKPGGLLETGGLRIDTLAREVRRGEVEIYLAAKEYELLLLFIRNKNIALSRERIYEEIWGGDYAWDSRTVDVHIQRLREKTGWKKEIAAVYRVGYRLEV